MSLTNRIILVCFIVFLVSRLLPEDFVHDNFFYSLSSFLAGNVYVVVTALFMHASFVHLLTNSMLLYVVGNALEEDGGPRKFALAFFLGGIASFMLSSPVYGINDLLVGNSGAVFTVMAVVAVVNPLIYRKSRPYKLVFHSGSEVSSSVSEDVLDKKNFLISVFILIMVQFTIISLYSVFISDGVSHLGHFIGFLIGLVFGIAWSEKLKGIIRRSGKFLVAGFLVLVVLVYAGYVVFHIVNPVSTSFIDDILKVFSFQPFLSETDKCNNYCLDNNYDYGLIESSVCTCMFNQSFTEVLG